MLQGADFYLTAYNELQYDRPIGMGIGAIPWSSIIRWAEFHGLSCSDDVDDLITIIRALENAVHEFDQRKDAK